MSAARSASSISGRVALRLSPAGRRRPDDPDRRAGRRLRLVGRPAAGRRHRERGRDRTDPGGDVRRRAPAGRLRVRPRSRRRRLQPAAGRASSADWARRGPNCWTSIAPEANRGDADTLLPASSGLRSPVRGPHGRWPSRGRSDGRRGARSSTTSSTGPAELPTGMTAETAPGHVPVAADRQPAGLRLRRRRDGLEALHPSVDRAADEVAPRRDPGRGRGGPPRRRRSSPSWACEPARSPPCRSRSARCAPDQPATPTTPPGAMPRSSSRSNARPRPAPASAPRWAPVPRSTAARTSSCPSSTRGSWSAPAATPAPRSSARSTLHPAVAEQLDRAARQVAAVRAAIGDPVHTDGLPERLRAALDSPALGRGRRTLPRLRQLHARLPDLLLHQRRRRLRPRRRRGLDRPPLGQLLQPRLRAGRRRRQLPAEGQGPLPPVADPQVLDLVGPVRLERLRRLRPVHRLVPGRHRRPRGAGGHRAAEAPRRPDPVAALAGRGPGARRPRHDRRPRPT